MPTIIKIAPKYHPNCTVSLKMRQPATAERIKLLAMFKAVATVDDFDLQRTFEKQYHIAVFDRTTPIIAIILRYSDVSSGRRWAYDANLKFNTATISPGAAAILLKTSAIAPNPPERIDELIRDNPL